MNKSTKVACLLPSLTNCSAAALSLPRRKHGSDMNDLNLDLQSVDAQDNRKIRSTAKHLSRISHLHVLDTASHGTKQSIKNLKQINMKKKVSRKLFFIVCIQGLLGLQQAYAATYYVSPTGSDSNNGTALSTPVKTIRQALSKAASSGDIVYVRAGTYAETVSINQSGITLSAYQSENPIIDGGTTLPSGDWGKLIFVTGNYNTVSGFEVKNSNLRGAYQGGYGIQVSGHHNTISKMNVHHIWENGILINGDNNIVEDSKVWQTAYRNSINSGTANWASALSAARNDSPSALIKGITSYAVLRRNAVYNNWGEGLSCYEVDHCTMEDNIVYDNWATNMYLSDATNSLVQRNLAYVSSSPAIPSSARIGLMMSDERASVPRSANNTIINNFIYNSTFDVFSWTMVDNSGLRNVLIANNTVVDGDVYIGAGGSPAIIHTNSQIRNNIITGRNSRIVSNSGIAFSDNNWSVNPPSPAASTSNILGDPQIARSGTTAPGALTSAYFKILGSSPVINAALPLSTVPNDFFKISRGTAPDIGGFEYQTSSGGTPSPTDSTAPSAPSGLAATAGSATQVNLAWNASTDNVSVTGYKIYRNGTEIGSNAATSFTDTTVAGGITYNYTVKAYDAAGNLSVASNTSTVNTPQSTSTVSISSYSAGSITANSATIKWTTNVPSTGVVSYGTSATNLSSQVSAGTQATSQSVQITGLTSGTVYYYKISASSGSVTSSFKTSDSSSSGTNIAPLASVIASSQNIYTNQQATKAIDRVVSGYPVDATREWATMAQKAGAWIQLNWSTNRQVNKVVLYDRPNLNDQITSATLTFSNGSTVKVGTLNNSGGAVVINFPSVSTKSVRVTVNTVSGSTVNVGLSELEVFGL
ncbi:MAG: right-handed parallel beta-helix repeat-containing protein [Methylobacter sp.]|nr:right-handed parallel beta-helix repeat-containing protein [Methylobacter sp.]